MQNPDSEKFPDPDGSGSSRPGNEDIESNPEQLPVETPPLPPEEISPVPIDDPPAPEGQAPIDEPADGPSKIA